VPIRAITFDFWGTLFADPPGRKEERRSIRIEAFSEAAGVSRDQARAAHDHAAQVFLRHHIEHQQTLTPVDAFEIMCSYCSVEMDDDERARMIDLFGTAILDAPPEPLPGSLEAVAAAAKRRPVGVVSDAGLSPGVSLRVLLDRHGFMGHFSSLVFSSEVGVAKPQRPMFERAAQELETELEGLLHIGDLEPTDVAGALAVGARAGLYTGHHDKYLDGTQAHHAFPSWDAFVNALPQLIDRDD